MIWLFQGRKSDCVLVCGKRAFNLHRSVLYSSTGLIQGILLKRSNTEPIVLDDIYSGLVEQCLSLIYRGQGIVTLDQLPLFTRMIRSIQLKYGAQRSTQWELNLSPFQIGCGVSFSAQSSRCSCQHFSTLDGRTREWSNSRELPSFHFSSNFGTLGYQFRALWTYSSSSFY